MKTDSFKCGAVAAIIAVILLTALAFVATGCRYDHNSDYWTTPNGYRIFHLDPGIDADTAMAAIEDGMAAWLTINGQQHQENARRLYFVIHRTWWFD